jgi:hypothetical protein
VKKAPHQFEWKTLAQAEGFIARVVKLVDAGDSKSPAARRAGSIPAPAPVQALPEMEEPIFFSLAANFTNRRLTPI